MKNTKSRKAILELLQKCPAPLSADSIFAALKDQGITLSTVYRSLQTFEAEGLVKKELSPHSKEALYSVKEEEHGHTLECVRCHKKIPLDYCPFEEVNEEIKKKTGFTLEEENSILYGVCAECAEKR